MKDENRVVMKTHWKNGLRRILLRGLSEKMAFKLKSSECEGAIRWRAGESSSRRKRQHVQVSEDDKSLVREALTEAGVAAASESRAEGRGRHGGRGPRARSHWRSMRRP